MQHLFDGCYTCKGCIREKENTSVIHRGREPLSSYNVLLTQSACICVRTARSLESDARGRTKDLGLLRESGSGILLVQKLLDYGAEESHQEKTQVVDVTPLTYKTVNGKDYVAIAVTQRFRGVTQRVCYVLDLKVQEYYVLSEKDYDTFITSGNVHLKDGSLFAAVVLVYAMANRDPSTPVAQATPTPDSRICSSDEQPAGKEE
jgi:hypothetical protein